MVERAGNWLALAAVLMALATMAALAVWGEGLAATVAGVAQ